MTVISMGQDINISFENISYTTKVGFFKKQEKTVLKNVSGEFNSRELSAIMGPSGSGKSSLLNILSGYNTSRNVTGCVKINGYLRDTRQFRRICSYIMQDHLLHPLLTVQEAMKFSVNLKVGNETSNTEKEEKIAQILHDLGLEGSTNTMTNKLSGGQQKRLSIALELVDDPQIMFFDEPSSGLDSVATTHCLTLLKKMAKNGRTIICTIHQPSALIFKTFDHIYAIADGECIYRGLVEKVVPFLQALDLTCPASYNPADYLLEVSTNDYGDYNEKLVEKIENGRSREFCKHSYPLQYNHNQLTMSTSNSSGNNSLSVCVKLAKLFIFDPRKFCNNSELYSTSFLRQFYFLYIRTFLLITRNPSLSAMRLGIHVFVAFFIGMIYYQTGNSAKYLMNNFKFIFYTVMFLMFTAFSSLQITFPSELPVIKREHFNRWYSFTAYYTSLILADMPFQILCTTLYILITYFLTSQVLEWPRFAGFFIINLLTGFVAQGLGMVVSSLFSVKYGCIFGNFFICPFLIFSGFFVQMNHAHRALHWLFKISFLKYALEGSVYALLGFNRERLECDESDEKLNYCRYSYPNQLLRDIGVQECAKDNINSTLTCDEIMYENQKHDFSKTIIVLIVFIVAFRLIAFCIMRYRLKH